MLSAAVLIAALSGLLMWGGPRRAADADKLELYCAAGLRYPVSEIARLYEEEHGVKIEIQFDGSNSLLTHISVNKFSTADLYLAADDFYTIGWEEGATPEPSETYEKLGDYDLLGVLGKGGMGVVYRARQRSANRMVALKVIHPERLDALQPGQRSDAVERFQTEAQAAARLEHEHIVTVYDVGQADGRQYFSMRLVGGRSEGSPRRRTIPRTAVVSDHPQPLRVVETFSLCSGRSPVRLSAGKARAGGE